MIITKFFENPEDCIKTIDQLLSLTDEDLSKKEFRLSTLMTDEDGNQQTIIITDLFVEAETFPDTSIRHSTFTCSSKGNLEFSKQILQKKVEFRA